MTSRAELAGRITARIAAQLRLPDGYELGRERDLAELGLSSLQSVVLVVGLEAEFGIAFDDDSLVVENFRTVDAIAALVEAYR
jgi:acyl carrier protein